ncbi:helix-turn-helix domain-containing protein [Devosia sp. J2-20]|uniref:helix-turn-helix domain-containing protein n=1 Tax=Devosia sp. J2-20 TaxID=3026161 RepID=UPI00249BE256|nr:helix-turn-helix domain-containing protein [Devosia sp. J2-20]WDR00731.1 helix-turn-helix domain-containing protein [Devosia sp. J2-20]
MDAAWTIARAKGGRQVYIPAQAAAGHWLTELVGLEAAQKICAFYRANSSGMQLLIPMGSAVRTKTEIAKAIEQGGSANQLAGEFGKHERTIRRHRARLRDTRQGKLF